MTMRTPKTVRRATLAALAVVAVVGTVVLNPLSYLTNPEEVLVDLPRETSSISLADLSRTVSSDGQLGYGNEIVVNHSGSGILTWIVDEGSTVNSGDVVYRVDNEPVVLFRGSTPAFRNLAVDDVGPDVEQLETALVLLGYDPAGLLIVDQTYTDYTATVVENWQTDLGIEVTGQLNAGSVIFAPGALTIGAHQAAMGDQITNGPVLSASDQSREIVFPVDVGDLDTIEVGASVAARLPDRSTIDASVVSLVSSGGSWIARAVVDNTEGLTKVASVPVTVQWTDDLVANVTVVPAVALSRFDDGTYNLEVVESDGTTQFVPVGVGLSSGGTVQIMTDLAEGTVIVAP